VIVEVIAVGTELLLGQIINRNLATIGERLAEDGFDAHHQVVVGDNPGRLADAIRTAVGRADAVVMTGGIGPTQDDLTRDALCEVAGVEMLRDEEHAELIRRRLLARGRKPAANVYRMADYPATSDPLPNAKGVALGVAIEIQGTPVFAMPGVPREMITMLDEQVRPRLRAASGDPAVLKNRVIRTWGYGESQVSEMLDDLYETTNPSVAFLINAAEVRIRVSAKAETEAFADAMIAEVESVIRERLGEAVFGVDDDIVEVIVVRRLDARGWRVGTVETLTAGRVAAQITSVPGGAGVLGRCVVVPSESLDVDVQQRPLDLLGEPGVEADVVVAISEVDGSSDGMNSSRRVGVAVRTPDGVGARTLDILGDDERARLFAVPGALHALRLALSGDWWDGAPMASMKGSK